MHMSDGVVSAPLWIGGYIIAAGIAASGMKRMKAEDMPKTAVMTSAFFVASLIHIPIGPTSVHLILNGLVGIILGPLSFISILLGLTLQTVLFQHGGITTIGINSLIMGIPALISYRLFRLHRKVHFQQKEVIFGVIAGILGPLLGAIILALLLIGTGTAFVLIAKCALIAQLPVIVVEGIITGFVVSFLKKVEPNMLG